MKQHKLLTKVEMKSIFGGEYLRKLRNEVCYSQEYMANQLGISQSTYQRIETGDIKISIERLSKISEILNKPIEKIISSFKNSKESAYESLLEEEIISLKRTIIIQQTQIENLNKLLQQIDR
jgi:transcriptional regulator with XRE-family HTH domain